MKILVDHLPDSPEKCPFAEKLYKGSFSWTMLADTFDESNDLVCRLDDHRCSLSRQNSSCNMLATISDYVQ